MKAWIFPLLISLALPSPAETLTSADGRSIDVTLVRKDDQKVWFKLKGKGRLMEYKIADLSADSQELVKGWEAPKSVDFKVSYASGKRNRKQAGGYDNRSCSVQPKITIQNVDQASDTMEVTAHLFIFGRPVLHRGTVSLIHRETFEIKSLAPFEETTVKSKKGIVFVYDDDDNGDMFGARYRGYTLLFTDKDGREVFRKSIPESGARPSLEKLQKLKERGVYDEDDLTPTGVRAIRM